MPRAVLVDRDPVLLARLAVELSRRGYSVETLDSVLGLTPDLLTLGGLDLLVVDAELPDLGAAELKAIVQALRAAQAVEIVATTDRDPALVRAASGADRVVARLRLSADGARAFAPPPTTTPRGSVDPRVVIDEVLRRHSAKDVRLLSATLDLLSAHNFYVAARSRVAAGVFIATTVLPATGQEVELKLNLFDRHLVETRGMVEWQRPRGPLAGKQPAGVGVRLGALKPLDEQAIERFLEAREPLVFSP